MDYQTTRHEVDDFSSVAQESQSASIGINNINELIRITLENLRSLPKEYITLIILELMQEGKLSFEEVAVQHARHLEALHKGESKRYIELRSMITNVYHSYKKDRDRKLKDIMHDLLDRGELNMTHESIESR